MAKTWYVYILKSIDKKIYYKGMTKNLDERIRKHNRRRVKSTAQHVPFKLIHVEVCQNRKEARKLEKYFKTGIGREVIKEINRSLN